METVQNYKCPCCDAPLIFDAKSQKLLCNSCGNSFPVETLRHIQSDETMSGGASKYDWEEYTGRSFENTDDIHLSDYSCPSCGAEISGDDTLGSAVCPYCGNSTVIKGQFEGSMRPDLVIPFKVVKKEAMEAFERDFKNAPFLPDSFKCKKKIEEMEGVYVPFWLFGCDCDVAVSYNAEHTVAWSDANYNYIKTDYYKLFRSGSVCFENIPVDASKKTDNTYMEAVEPYVYDDAVNFSSDYLSGYFADKFDVSAEESVERANERVKNSAVKLFGDTTNRYTAVLPESVRVGFSDGKIRYALLPVWMLNIKYSDKMYKFMINGQTGKVVGEYPVDNGKKWKYIAKIASIAYAAAALAGFLLLW